ncbi:MAG: hypothetical protein IH788_05740, partial [Nitrospinae bacterium]|nr:hypothetical protein [Nitrospinota bacterium]
MAAESMKGMPDLAKIQDAIDQAVPVKGSEDTGDYQYGFHYPDESVFRSSKGLRKEVVEEISWIKEEPEWMLKLRLEALEIFYSKPLPQWGGDLNTLDFDDIYYYVRPTDSQGKTWDDIPENIKETFDRIGIPEDEQKFLGGVGAQYDSEVVYHNIREDLAKQGVIFLGMDQGLAEHEELVREYFGTLVPAGDNKYSALNSAVWSGGSFIYVPPGVSI